MAMPQDSALAHWQRMEGLVHAWLRERQQLLYLLCSVEGIQGLNTGKRPLEERVSRLCEVLMDYISAGYFEIYQELARQARWLDTENSNRIRHILMQLQDSTEEALRFNEDYDVAENIRARKGELPARLSRLLEKLEERFALEDQLILSIHRRPGHTATTAMPLQ